MILCAERFDKEQPEPLLPIFGDLSDLTPTNERPLPSGDWAWRQTQVREFDTMTLFADRSGRINARRVRATIL